MGDGQIIVGNCPQCGQAAPDCRCVWPDGAPSVDMPIGIYVIYDHPRDFPNDWVKRTHWVHAGRIEIEAKATLFKTLEEARASMPKWARCIGRSPSDDPVIAECWI